MGNISIDTNRSARIILSVFIPAYLRGLDVKTEVYDKFVNRMSTDNGPQYEERKKILNNCLYFFTNNNSKKKIENLRQQMVADGKTFSYNTFATEILSTFPDDIFADYIRECYAEITALPSFAHAYINGLDANTVYEQLASEISSDNDYQSLEKKKILANCLSFFNNDNCLGEINSLRQKLAEAGKDISDYSLARAILSNFPEVILSTSRREFAETVLTSFVHARKQESDVGALYKKLRSRVPDDNSSQNIVKGKILENCFALFQNTQAMEKFDEDKLPDEELAKKIMDTFSERILGDAKRKYDMSDKYSKGMIDSKSFRFIPSSVYDELYLKDDNSNAKIMLCRLGKLTYGTASIGNESIDKYAVSLLEDGIVTQSYEVFSDINFDELLKNKEYHQAVLDGLLSINNIELSNACGYIGEIDDPNTSYEQQIGVGEEVDDGYGTYRYRVSEEHHLVFESEPATAVMMWVKSQELNKKEEIKNGDSR